VTLWPFHVATESFATIMVLRPLSLISATVLLFYSWRFVRVDQKLDRINANGISGIFTHTRDRQMATDERMAAQRHPLSAMNPRHDVYQLLMKFSLTLITSVCGDVAAAVLCAFLGALMMANDIFYKSFIERDSPKMDWNSVKAAASTSVAVNYVAGLFATMAPRNEHGQMPMLMEALVIAVHVLSIPIALAMHRHYIRVHEKSVLVAQAVERHYEEVQHFVRAAFTHRSKKSDLETPLLDEQRDVQGDE